MAGRRIHYVQALHETYGAYVRLSPTEIAVNDVRGFEQIHGINSGFTKSPWYLALLMMERPGLLAILDNKAHAVRRRMFARAFSKTHLREHWEGAVRDKVELAVSRLQEEARSSGTTDMLKWWTFMASDVSSHLMFGDSFHTLERGEVNDYIRALQKALKGSGIGAEMPIVRKVGGRLSIHAARELFGAIPFLMDYAQVAVNNMKSQQGGKNIFANMMAEAEKGERLDDTDVKLQATGFIIAGTDTTAITLTYLVWAVLSRPALQRELEAEIAMIPDGYRDMDLEGLPLLNAIIEETLRLYGALPGMLPRMVPPGAVDLGGHYMPQGTTTTTQSYSLHRDPNIFPDPTEFLPSRFLAPTSKDDKHRISEAGKAVFSPFGAGSRTRLGLHLAYMELRLAAVEFFRRRGGSVKLAPSATAACMEPGELLPFRTGWP